MMARGDCQDQNYEDEEQNLGDLRHPSRPTPTAGVTREAVMSIATKRETAEPCE